MGRSGLQRLASWGRIRDRPDSVIYPAGRPSVGVSNRSGGRSQGGIYANVLSRRQEFYGSGGLRIKRYPRATV